MFATLFTLVLTPAALGADASLQAGVQLTYKGHVARLQEDRTPSPALKTFDLVVVVAEANDSGARLYWQVDELGQGRWPWVERFGEMSADADWRTSGVGPSLLFERGEEYSVIPLPPLFLKAKEPVAEDSQWEDGKLRYKTQKSAKLEDHPAWQVLVTNNFGRQRVVWLDKQSPLLWGVDQRVFMGMGEEYILELRLLNVEPLEEPALAATNKGYDALVQMRARLNRRPRTEDPNFDAKQLASLQKYLPDVQQAVTTGQALKLVKAAARDLGTQNDRAGAVQDLAAQHVGRPAPSFMLDGIGGAALKSDDLKGAVTVLHFWEYRDAPLKQPYGQIGYLDFLYNQRKKDGVKLYGVAVDGRLRDGQSRGAAIRSVRNCSSS